MTSQWVGPTLRFRFIRVCAANSLTSVMRRGTKGPLRVASGWPRRMTRTKRAIVAANMPQATRPSRTESPPSVSCRAPIFRVPFVRMDQWWCRETNLPY